MLEGFLLYKALIVVFDSGFNRVLPLYVFGYGVPAIIVVITLITAVIRENSDSSVKYLHDDLCWLSSHYVWALTGPAVFVILFNTVILFMGLRVTWKVVHFQMIKLAGLHCNCSILGPASKILGQLSKGQEMASKHHHFNVSLGHPMVFERRCNHCQLQPQKQHSQRYL